MIKHWISTAAIVTAGALLCQTATADTGQFNRADYTVCFTPGGACTHSIVHTIAQAKKSIEVQAYSFTSAPIVKALIQAQKRGVRVFVLLDKSNVSSKYSVVNTLQNHHIPFLIDDKPAIAHNKVMIIDAGTKKAVLITGSFNFTSSAQKRNAENVLIIDSQSLAADYLANFHRRKAASKSYAQYCMGPTHCKLRATAHDLGKSIESGTSKSWDATKHAWHKVTTSAK
tara:strand:+ start:936 stop:1619 length:684 start_codon:yes stop_codon:yes gene_type:complete